MRERNILRFHLGLALAAIATVSLADEAAPPPQLDEVVVTAQRREADPQSVPISLTALGAKALVQRGVTDFQSYMEGVPGAYFQDSGGFGNEVKFRGIGTGNYQVSPTTAIYFGDIPIIHTGRNATSSYDFEVVDFDRIEVLRGPQGQLYGANALGGAIKNIPYAPVLGTTSIDTQLTGETMSHGNETGNGSAVLNLPLGESAAARLVGYAGSHSGYYQDVFAGGPPLKSLLPFPLPPAIGDYQAPARRVSDTNTLSFWGARASLLWEPSQVASVDLVLAVEHKDTPGASYAEEQFDTDYRAYQHSDVTAAGTADEIRLASLTVNYDLGAAKVTSVTGWWLRDTHLARDFSGIPLLGPSTANAIPLNTFDIDRPRSFTQELRVVSQGDSRWNWLAGVFFQQLDQDYSLDINDLSGLDILVSLAPFPVPGDVVGHTASNYKDRQLAAFGQLGLNLTPTLSAAVSGRRPISRWATPSGSATTMWSI